MVDESDVRNTKLLLVLVISFSLFFAVLNFLSLYVERNYTATCPSALPLTVVVNILIAGSILSGAFVTLFFINKSSHKRREVHKDTMLTLNFLDAEEKNIIKLIIDSKGVITQSKLVKLSGINKVKVTRILHKLELKGVIVKKPYGNTNKVELVQGLKELFNCEVCSR